jgi:hypothetical protein
MLPLQVSIDQSEHLSDGALRERRFARERLVRHQNQNEFFFIWKFEQHISCFRCHVLWIFLSNTLHLCHFSRLIS